MKNFYKYKESSYQIALVNYLKLQYPNILFTGGFAGDKLGLLAAIRRKKMGYIAGTPDLFIAEPRNNKHGIWLEMKKEGGTLSPNQKEFIKKAIDRNYEVLICYNFNEARDKIDKYLKGN